MLVKFFCCSKKASILAMKLLSSIFAACRPSNTDSVVRDPDSTAQGSNVCSRFLVVLEFGGIWGRLELLCVELPEDREPSQCGELSVLSCG